PPLLCDIRARLCHTPPPATTRYPLSLHDALPISDGRIIIGDRVVNDLPPKDRNVAMVFQSYALYPHMSVRDNLAYPLKLRKVPKAEREQRVREAARILDIEQYLARKPNALSGGRRQRDAHGRAIVRSAYVLPMDEP